MVIFYLGILRLSDGTVWSTVSF